MRVLVEFYNIWFPLPRPPTMRRPLPRAVKCLIMMVRYPLEVLAIFDIVLMNMVGRINPLFENHIQTRISNLKSSTSVRNLNPSDVERMVSLKGMIIRSSSIIPEIREAIFGCLLCNYQSHPVVINRGQIN